MELVFLLGSPRSGTTWLQEILACHPSVASPQELKVVHEYLVRWRKSWNRQPLDDPAAWKQMRFTGLAGMLTSDELDDQLRRFALDIYAKCQSLKPGSTHVLDKDPPNCMHTDLIERVLRPAAYIHLIRDGRDVAESLLSARRSWGPSWTPGNVATAARTWKAHVTGGRRASSASRYIEVRYEDLRSDPSGTLVTVLDFLGLPHDEDLVGAMLAAGSGHDAAGTVRHPLRDALVWSGEVVERGYVIDEPEGFFGNRGGGWRSWPAWKSQVFDFEAGDLMRDLGYGSGLAAGGRGPRRVYAALSGPAERAARTVLGRRGR